MVKPAWATWRRESAARARAGKKLIREGEALKEKSPVVLGPKKKRSDWRRGSAARARAGRARHRCEREIAQKGFVVMASEWGEDDLARARDACRAVPVNPLFNALSPRITGNGNAVTSGDFTRFNSLPIELREGRVQLAADGKKPAQILRDPSGSLGKAVQHLEQTASQTFRFGEREGGFSFVTSVVKSTLVGGPGSAVAGAAQPFHADGIVNDAWLSQLKRSPGAVPLTAIFALSPANVLVAPFSYKVWAAENSPKPPLEIQVVNLSAGDILFFRQDLLHAGTAI